MTITLANRVKPEIWKDQIDTLYFEFLIDGVKTTPTSATVTITSKGNEAMPDTAISGAAAVVSGSTISYAFTAAQTANLGVNYRAQWVVVYDSDDYHFMQLFDIVRYKFEILIGKEDLVAACPQLDAQEFAGDTNFQDPIITAHNIVIDRIRDRNDRPALIIDNTRLIMPHVYLTLALIYLSFSTETDDIYWNKAKDYESKFDIRFDAAMTSILKDSDEDTLPDAEPTNMALNYVRRGG